MISTSLFPYETLPIRLCHQDSQKGMVTCFFQCEEHLEKYLERHNIHRKKSEIKYKHDESFKSGQTNKNSLGSGESEIHSGGSNSTRGRPKKLDSTGTVGKDRKSKQ